MTVSSSRRVRTQNVRGRHRALLLVLTLAVVSVWPGAQAGTPEAPEIVDATGDADPGSTTGLAPGTVHMLGGNLSAYDIKDAYLTFEARDSFVLVLHVVDLDGGLGEAPVPPLPPPPPVPVPAPVPATPTYFANYTLHFTIEDTAYTARAELRTNGTAMWSNWTVAAGGQGSTDVFGWVLAQRNEVGWIVPKAAVGEPQPGTALTNFYATAGHDAVRLDYAPDPQAVDPTQVDPLGGDPDIMSPGYGFDYTFGQYPGGPVQQLVMAASGATNVQVTAGERQELGFTVRNDGPQDAVVQLAVRSPRGWSAELDVVDLTIPAGSTKGASVTVSPEADARDGTLRVTARSSTGASADVRYALERLDADGTGTGTSGGTPTGGSGTGSPYAGGGSSSGDSNDAPGAPVVVVTGALVAVAAALRRRR